MENNDGSRMKTRPSQAVLTRAMRSRESVVAVIVWRPPTPPDTELDKSWGSGFIIKDGPPCSLVLTCQHVVEGAQAVRIRRVVGAREGVQEFAATVLRDHELSDIAVLRVPGLRSAVPLSLNFTLPRQVNEPAVAIGYCNPEGLFDDEVSLVRMPTTSPGCIREDADTLPKFRREAGKRKIGQAARGVVHELIILDCAGYKGGSGGPVVDTRGVIGMAIKIGADMPIMLAVSSRTIMGILKVFARLPTADGQATMEEAFSRLVAM